MDASSARITGGPFPETRLHAAPALQPASVTQAVEKQGNPQSQPEVALNLPASEGPKAAPLVHGGAREGEQSTTENAGQTANPVESSKIAAVSSALNLPASEGPKAAFLVPGGEREGEQSTTENAGPTANPVESSKIAAVSPAVNGTQSTRETAQDQVVETKVPPKDPGTMQDAKTEPAHTDPAAVKLPPATPGTSKTTSAALKKPVSPKLPQSPGDAGTKKGLKTAKAETTVKNPPARFEQSLQPGAGDGIVADLKSLPKPAARPEPKWHELAPQVKDAIPNMSVSMLVYSRKPEERWININGAKRREGQEISSGLKVEEITPDGAIFSYMGQRFYKGVVGD